MNVEAIFDAIGAPERLRAHGDLVAEAAAPLVRAVRAAGLVVDDEWVLAGAALHDAGKAIHRDELDAPGHRHEEAGEALLLSHGVDPRVAHCCVSHASWSEGSALEELLVALADKLWKGVRNGELEALVVDAVARGSKRERWDVFLALDACFEEIAAGGPERLHRSVRRG